MIDRSDGTVVGAAAGLPPPWIDSVGGGEAWALFQATYHAEPADGFILDCLGTLRALVRGKTAATAGHVRLARVNKLLHQQFDASGDVDRVVWMPSHRAEHEVGVALKSGGTYLTHADRSAINLADRLAKAAAAKHRVPADVRARIAADEANAEAIAILVGRITHAANNCDIAGLPRRDSAPTDALGAWRKKKRGTPSRSRTVALRPPTLGGAHPREDSRWMAVQPLPCTLDALASAGTTML